MLIGSGGEFLAIITIIASEFAVAKLANLTRIELLSFHFDRFFRAQTQPDALFFQPHKLRRHNLGRLASRRIFAPRLCWQMGQRQTTSNRSMKLDCLDGMFHLSCDCVARQPPKNKCEQFPLQAELGKVIFRVSDYLRQRAALAAGNQKPSNPIVPKMGKLDTDIFARPKSGTRNRCFGGGVSAGTLCIHVRFHAPTLLAFWPE